jgi:hypothetical protein
MLLIVGLIVLAALLVSAAVIFRPAGLFTDKPEAVVQKFYDWYLDYEQNPLVDKAYQSSKYLTEDFIGKLDSITSGNIIADPILCAQDLPEYITPGKATINDDKSSVPVTTSFEGHGFDVVLSLENGDWLIDDVVCHP